MRRTSSRDLRGCLECGRGWEHCHGTLTVHADSSVECSDTACITVESAHIYTLSCVELRGGGCCE